MLRAIEVLTAANRMAPDPAVELTLVRLRHEAFAHLDRPSPAPTMEPIVADPPGPGTLPELEPGDLTVTSLRRGLARNGCVLIRGLVDLARVDQLRQGIDRALAAFDAD